MLRLAADENFNALIVGGLIRRRAVLDILRVQDAGLNAAIDPDVLSWAADDGRDLLTHDRETMPRFAFDRVRAGRRMPRLFVVNDRAAIGPLIDEILRFVDCSLPGEWEDRVVFLPMS